jgi:hypothetical protein
MRELYREIFGAQHDGSGASQDEATGFAAAVQSASQIDARAPHPDWAMGTADEPDEDDDLLDQLRLVVIENQRYDRIAEPVM